MLIRNKHLFAVSALEKVAVCKEIIKTTSNTKYVCLLVKMPPLRTSGATYPGVPHCSFVSIGSLERQASPKSEIHI